MKNENLTTDILEGLLFPKLFRCFWIAIQPSMLIIALGLIAGIAFTGWVLDLRRTVATTPRSGGQETELTIFLTNPQRIDSYIQKYQAGIEQKGVFSTLWRFSIEKFHATLRDIFSFNFQGVFKNVTQYLQGLEWAIKYHWIYCAIFGLINLCLLSIAGGAICRIAALQFARDEKPGITEAISFSIKKFTSFFTAPLIPAGFVALIIAVISFLGLAANIPLGIGEIITAFLVPLALLFGAVAAAIITGTIGGLNLTFPAIAYDGCDGLDAVSRTCHYVFVRPWRLGFYTFIAVIYGGICYLFVRFFAFLLLWSTYTGLRLGAALDSRQGLPDKIMAIWPEPSFGQLTTYSTLAGSWSESVAAFLVFLFTLVVVGLVVSFIISFYFTVNTVIYALLRNRVENTPLDEIYTPVQQPRPRPDEPTLLPLQ